MKKPSIILSNHLFNKVIYVFFFTCFLPLLSFGQNKTIFDAVLNDSIEAVEYYLNKNVDIDTVTYDSITPLMYAADIGSTKITKLLLERGAKTDIVPPNGKTALMASVIGFHLETSELLLQYGANPNSTDYYKQTALHYAVENGDSVMTEMLLDYDAKLTPNAKGDSELIIASHNGDISLIILLLEYGADTNHKNIFGRTALYTAAQNGYLNVVKALCEAGCDLNITDNKDYDALSIAVKQNNLEIAKYLVANGGDIQRQISDNIQVITLSKFNRNKEMTKYLKKQGAKDNLKPYIYKMTIGMPMLFSKKDFLMGFETGIHDLKQKTSLNIGFMSRPARAKVLIQDSKYQYSQYRERRSLFYLSLEKEFPVIWGKYHRFGLYLGAKVQYSYGNYRGVEQKAPIKLPVSPLVGIFAEGEFVGLKLGYEYTDWGYHNLSPNKILLSLYVNITK